MCALHRQKRLPIALLLLRLAMNKNIVVSWLQFNFQLPPMCFYANTLELFKANLGLLLSFVTHPTASGAEQTHTNHIYAIYIQYHTATTDQPRIVITWRRSTALPFASNHVYNLCKLKLSMHSAHMHTMHWYNAKSKHFIDLSICICTQS